MPGFGKILSGLGKATKAAKPIISNAGKIGSKLKSGYKQFKATTKGFSSLKNEKAASGKIGSSIDIGDISQKKTPKIKQLITRNEAVRKNVQQYRQQRLNSRVYGSTVKNPKAKTNFENRVNDQGFVGKAKQAGEIIDQVRDKTSNLAVDAYNRRLILQQMGLVPDNLIPDEQQGANNAAQNYIHPYLRNQAQPNGR